MPTKTAQKKTPQEQAPKAAGGGKANALQRPLRPSEALAAVVGPGPLPRGEVVSKVWDYINPDNSFALGTSSRAAPCRAGWRSAATSAASRNISIFGW